MQGNFQYGIARKARTSFIGFALLAVVATTPQAHANTDLQARLEAVVRRVEAQELFSGSVLVTQRGQTLFRQGFGQADRENGIANGADTRFVLASVTKQFTSVLVLRQVERGQIRLEAPVDTYLANLPKAWRAVTIHQLLNHSSGIPDHLKTATLNPIRDLDLKPTQVVDHLRKLPMLFAPGLRHSYSNTNYLLLGMVLEQVTGKPLREQLRTEILEPLALGSTGVEPALGAPAPSAKGYRHSGKNRWIAGLPIHPSILFCSGDLYSDVADLDQWTETFWMSYRLVGHATRELMTTPSAGRYAYGFRTDRPKAFEGRDEIYHTGSAKGFSNYLGRFVDDQLTIVVLGNLTGAPARAIAHELAGVVLNLRQP